VSHPPNHADSYAYCYSNSYAYCDCNSNLDLYTDAYCDSDIYSNFNPAA